MECLSIGASSLKFGRAQFDMFHFTSRESMQSLKTRAFINVIPQGARKKKLRDLCQNLDENKPVSPLG
ncbi:hypothetical protein CEXT_404301 [Caerostris extrusa]|uniref:Uncharacterized protein n=1 Tax=Caerostris extrusa TaxID=172846 RepID=A0AAV4XIT6_CAEEX|nr:hypothetical protein CEXT_404301 [Caerostris extrusa]